MFLGTFGLMGLIIYVAWNSLWLADSDCNSCYWTCCCITKSAWWAVLRSWLALYWWNMQHEMTERVVVLLDVLFICGSNAYSKSCRISPQGKQSFGCWQCCWMCWSFVAVMRAPSLVESHLKVSRVLVVVFVPLIRIYIMALPCLLSRWPELSPTSSDSISLVGYRVWVWFFSLRKINIWNVELVGFFTTCTTYSFSYKFYSISLAL